MTYGETAATVTVETKQGKQNLNATLVVAADGRRSPPYPLQNSLPPWNATMVITLGYYALLFTDALNRIFSNNWWPLVTGRRWVL
ncbi:hypothetical protein [Picosynechococcus sp. PCC 7117]|uniref:hypothetical protein n=1 Tax=Picosynechococcus sp. PCC 7117 TaxID=195498 RepID=UPI0030D84729